MNLYLKNIFITYNYNYFLQCQTLLTGNIITLLIMIQKKQSFTIISHMNIIFTHISIKYVKIIFISNITNFNITQ